MAAYEYTAIDGRGQSRKGVLTGESPRQVRAALRGQGLFPVEVEAVQERGGERGTRGTSRRRIPVAALALMTRQLATLVRAGMPLEQALSVLGEQVRERALQAVVAGIRARITEGDSLSVAVGRFQGCFPAYYRTMIEAGEASGRLDDILDRLADYTESQQAMRQKVGVAMIYPVLLTAVASAVVLVLLTWVIPEVVRVFEQTGQTLPWLTRALITVSGFLRNWYLPLGIVIALLPLAWLWLLRVPGMRERRDALLLRLPLVGDLILTFNAARLARLLAILTESGVALLDALLICVRILRNLPVRRALEEAAVVVREGGRLHTALAASGRFPPMLVHLIASGEEGGDLDRMLDKAATQQERELTMRITALTALVEPVLILVMGVVVLLIVLAILLPIFEMNQLAGM